MRGADRPAKPRWGEIPKGHDPSAKRRLGILTVRDRVVQAALKQIIEPILEPRFLPCSFGFRPGRSVSTAWFAGRDWLAKHARQRACWGVQLDVASCFASLSHARLMDAIEERIGDRRILQLLRSVLTAGAAESGWSWLGGRHGVVEGSPLSPLLCNLYLHEVDKELSTWQQETGTTARYLRYADDLLLLGTNAKVLRAGIRRIRQVLHRLGLRIGRGTKPAPIEAGIPWLGVVIQRRKSSPSVAVAAFFIPVAKAEEMRQEVEALTPLDVGLRRFDPTVVRKRIEELNQQLHVWHQTYRFAGNAPEVFRLIDDAAQGRVRRMLERATGLHGMHLTVRATPPFGVASDTSSTPFAAG